MRECPSCGAIEKGNVCSFCEYEFVKKEITVTPLLTPLKKKKIVEGDPLKQVIWWFLSVFTFFTGIAAANGEGGDFAAIVSFLLAGLCAYSAYKQATKKVIMTRIAFALLFIIWIISL